MPTFMTEQDIAHLKKLPLHSEHERFGGKFGAFGEWYVPLYYTSVLEEHERVRNKVGVFDISHMGEFYVRGKGARAAINQWITNDAGKLFPGRALYSPVCRPNGGIVDDVVVFEEDPEIFLIVVNAANINKDFAWFSAQGGCASSTKLVTFPDGTTLENKSNDIALFAVQGPQSRPLITSLFDIDLSKISYYHFMKLSSPFGELVLSETGYTGEEGFEIFCPIQNAGKLWRRLFEVGKEFDLKPIGFGARDTLRLESKFLLYGHDMNDETSPVEAGLSWTIGWDKDDFIGKKSLDDQKLRGVKRKLIGFELTDRGIAREGCSIQVGGKNVGYVTSGTFSPTLKKSIGLAYVSTESSQIGQSLEIEVRGKLQKAQIVKTPFYKRLKSSLAN